MISYFREYAVQNKNQVRVTVLQDDDIHASSDVLTISVNKKQTTKLDVHITNGSPHSVTLNYCDFTVAAKRSKIYKLKTKLRNILITSGK